MNHACIATIYTANNIICNYIAIGYSTISAVITRYLGIDQTGYEDKGCCWVPAEVSHQTATLYFTNTLTTISHSCVCHIRSYMYIVAIPIIQKSASYVSISNYRNCKRSYDRYITC